jgi:ribosome maturation factor RimP
VGIGPLFFIVLFGFWKGDAMKADSMMRRAWQVLEEDLQNLGYELVELEFARQGGSPLLRVFIDKEEGKISLDDCTRASQVLSTTLDALDFISERYLLEVSSPGWNRPVRKRDHFVRYIGYSFQITTEAPVEGRTRFKGVLTGVETDLLRLNVSDTDVVLHLENIKKARLDR